MTSVERPAAGPRPRRDPRQLGLPLASWPHDDRAAWHQAIAVVDLLSEGGGRASHWAPAGRRKVAGSYGCYLGWLARRGRLDPDRPGASRLTLDLVTAYLQERQGRVTDVTRHSNVTDLWRFARAVHPDHDWRWMARLEAGLRQRCGRAGDKKRSRFRSVAELVALGDELMRQSGQADLRRREGQLAYRDGLMIALLALRPLRLGNFASLTLGESLQRQGSRWWIVLAAEETKNRHPLELPFPDTLVPALDHYLVQVRPRLLGTSREPGCPAAGVLWISLRGASLRPFGVYRQIVHRTKSAFGLPVNPHLFRDCGATSLALASPQAVRAGAFLLGHASYDTTERYYNLACAIDAASRHHAVLQNLRGPARRRPRR
ncbi:MAG: tyrosine-type recombinase/integrase [Geminicoccaceae bacterium]